MRRAVASPMCPVFPGQEKEAKARSPLRSALALHRVLGRRTVRAGGALAGWRVGGDDGEDDVVLVFFEFKDELDVFEFVENAEVDGGGGTEEIHGFGGQTGP